MLAYRNLNLDVKNKAFKPDEDITICTQFTIGGEQENIRRYLDADEYELLSDFEKNLEKIKDAITEKNGARAVVDDMPYVIGLGMDCALNLHEEYKAILDMYEKRAGDFSNPGIFRRSFGTSAKNEGISDRAVKPEHQSRPASCN